MSLTTEIAHTGADTAKVKLFLAIANAHRGENVTKRFSAANNALALSETLRWATGVMHAEEILGECYTEVLAYTDALAHFRKSIAASRKIARQDIERVDLQYMIHCYHMLDSFEQAASYQKLLLDLTAQTGDHLAVCNQMSAYAERLSDLGRNREAVMWLQRDVRLAETHLVGNQKADEVADNLNTLATIYVKTSQTDSALICLQRASVLAKQIDNQGLAAYLLSSYCDVYAAAKNYDSAIYYGELTMQRAKLLNIPNLQLQYAQVLSVLYKGARQPEAALRYHLMYDSLSDMATNAQRTVDQILQVSRINLEQQGAINKLEKHSLEATKKSQRTALTAALVAILTLIIFTAIIYRSLRQNQKSNRTISRQTDSLKSQNELIDGALRAKELMLKETHHRIKNNLQLISSLLELQVAAVDDVHARDALRTAQRRIHSIATVHSKLYGSSDDEQIDLSDFVSDLFTRLAGAFGSSDCAMQFENGVPPTPLPLNVVVVLGLILNELITNSFKHACRDVAESAVSISLTGEGNDYTLLYCDAGDRLPQEKFDTPTGSVGLYLIKRLSKQLKGTANYTHDGRNRFTISFRIDR